MVRRSMVDDVLDLIKSYNPNALYTIEAIRFVNKGIFHDMIPTSPVKRSIFHQPVRVK
ncbi:MAG: hypothetical protein R2744_10940 [Bacteroidales bacterium]